MTPARSFLTIGLLLAAAPLIPGAHRPEIKNIYIGAYTQKGSEGIYLTHFDEKTGKLTAPQLAAHSADPSFLALHPTGPWLYAVNEGTAQVSAFTVDGASGMLTLLNQKPTGGNGPCHLALDATGHMLVVANYDGGSVATFPVGTDGRLGDRKTFIQFSGSGPNTGRQTGPHAHSTTFAPDSDLLLVDDLGSDTTHIYKAQPSTAEITEVSTAKADPGAGPRHLAFGPGGKFVYVLNELRSTITRYAMDGAALRKIDSVSTLPPSFHGSNTSAEIEIDRKGHFLYASNRGHDSIAVFAIDPSGTIRLVQHVSSAGRAPRSFTIDPSGKWLLAANQDSDNVVVFRVDPKTGWLKQAGVEIKVSSPVCVLFKDDHR